MKQKKKNVCVCKSNESNLKWKQMKTENEAMQSLNREK